MPDLSGVHGGSRGAGRLEGSVQPMMTGFRTLCAAALGVLLLGGAFAVWPLLSAYQIKEAVKSGDVATLARKVHWVPVRASLKASIAALTPQTLAAAPAPAPSLSLWGRIKAVAAPMLAETFIDRYATPEGVTELYRNRRAGWKGMLGMAPSMPAGGAAAAMTGALQGGGDHSDAPSAWIRFQDFYSRLVRAKFHSLSQVEFEIADRNTPDRRYVSLFKLADFEWKLASLRVEGVPF